jgi:hypothetical protein
MGIFDSIKKSIFGTSFESKLMKSIDKPTFIKDLNRESEEMIRLNQLLHNAIDEETKRKLQNELNLQRYVQDGLNKVYFELTNSPIPFYGLHNIRLEQNGTAANIDFLLVTNQFCCILKCKSLQGNIEIDSQGNFSRWVKKGEKWSKEGLYSPVEQNRRAEIMLKNVLSSEFNIHNLPVLSLTIFTNPKATLNFKECPNEIIEKVIKVDLLNTKLKELVENTSAPLIEEAKVLGIGEGILKQNTSKSNIPEAKIEESHTREAAADLVQEVIVTDSKKASSVDNKDDLVKALKAYRTSIATANNIPPYFVYNNEEMDKLIDVMPKNKEELLKIKGFGQVKFDKYGNDILNIINTPKN